MEMVFHFGTSAAQYSMESTTRRIDGSGGKMNSFCAMNSLRMSFCSVPPSFLNGTPCFSATARYMHSRIAAGELIVITTSMTINSPAAILLCMYLAVAEKQGVPFKKLGGTLQNDILKEFIAQKEFIFPPEPSMRLVVDSIEYCAAEVPKWNTISISGYHIREAGSTA